MSRRRTIRFIGDSTTPSPIQAELSRARDQAIREAQAKAGGKMRRVEVAGRGFDAGPTVLTMKWVFEALFAAAGRRMDDDLKLVPSTVIARHYWRSGACLDLHADQNETIRAIGDFAGRREAEGYRRFAADSRRTFEVLKDSFIEASRPTPVSLSRRIGLGRPADLLAISPRVMNYKIKTLGIELPRRRSVTAVAS